MVKIMMCLETSIDSNQSSHATGFRFSVRKGAFKVKTMRYLTRKIRQQSTVWSPWQVWTDRQLWTPGILRRSSWPGPSGRVGLCPNDVEEHHQNRRRNRRAIPGRKVLPERKPGGPSWKERALCGRVSSHIVRWSQISLPTGSPLGLNSSARGELERVKKRRRGVGAGWGEVTGELARKACVFVPPASFYKSRQLFRARCFPIKRSGGGGPGARLVTEYECC